MRGRVRRPLLRRGERDSDQRDQKRSPFSIDQNVWGRAVETGFLEHLWNAPTKDVYDHTEDPTLNWNTPTKSSWDSAAEFRCRSTAGM